MPRINRSDGQSPSPTGECDGLAIEFGAGAVWVPSGGQLVPQHPSGPGWNVFGVRLVDACSYCGSPALWQSQQG